MQGDAAWRVHVLSGQLSTRLVASSASLQSQECRAEQPSRESRICTCEEAIQLLSDRDSVAVGLRLC